MSVAETLTADDVITKHYAMTISCGGPCRTNRGVALTTWSPALRARPLKALFKEGRFRCSRCGTPSDGLRVELPPGVSTVSGPILDLRS